MNEQVEYLKGMLQAYGKEVFRLGKDKAELETDNKTMFKMIEQMSYEISGVLPNRFSNAIDKLGSGK